MILFKIFSATGKCRFILAAPGEDITPQLQKGEEIGFSEDVEQFLGGPLKITEEARFPLADADASFTMKGAIRALEKRMILRAWKKTHGHLSNAARLLGFRHHGSLQAILDRRHKGLIPAKERGQGRKRSIIGGEDKKKGSGGPAAAS